MTASVLHCPTSEPLQGSLAQATVCGPVQVVQQCNGIWSFASAKVWCESLSGCRFCQQLLQELVDWARFGWYQACSAVCLALHVAPCRRKASVSSFSKKWGVDIRYVVIA